LSIKLKKLGIENLNSFKGKHEINFLEHQGNLVFVKGIDLHDMSSNGAGKSTIIEGIVLAFFGKSIKKELNLDDLICIDAEKKFWELKLEFFESSGGKLLNEYIIVRRRNPPNTIVNLYINGEEVSKDLTNTETQTKIENILGIDYFMFMNNNVLNPELFKFIKSSSTQKIETLEKVLNLNIISKMYNILTKSEKDDEENYKAINTEFYALEKTLEGLLKQEDEVRKNVEEQIEVLSSNIEKNKVILETKQVEFSDLQKVLVEKQKVVKETTERLNPVIEQLSALEFVKKECIKSIKFYEKNENCETCKQPLPNRQEIIDSKKIEGKAAKDEIARLEELQKEINSVDVWKEQADVEKTLAGLKSDIRDLNYNIEHDSGTVLKMRSLTSQAEQIKDTKNKIEEIQNEHSEAKFNLKATAFWRELLTPKSPHRMKLAGDLIKVLNININKFIANFYTKDVKFNFVVNDNSISEQLTIAGKKIKYDQMSSGEKQKIDIIIVLSLLDIAMTFFKNNRLKFLIVDEATDHLDNIWARYVIEFIKQYAVQLNCMVLLISHHSVVEELDYLFDNKIFAIKDVDGNSRISYTGE